MKLENQITISDSGLYAQFLLENYLDVLVKETKIKVNETGISISGDFLRQTEEEEFLFYKNSFQNFLSRFIEGTAVEWAKITLPDCK